MSFKEKYTTASAKDNPKEVNKIVVSDDTFLQAEMLEQLTNELKYLRLKNG